MAGDPGFEPGQTESESVVLPLHKSPRTSYIILSKITLVNSFLKIFLNFGKNLTMLLFYCKIYIALYELIIG